MICPICSKRHADFIIVKNNDGSPYGMRIGAYNDDTPQVCDECSRQEETFTETNIMRELVQYGNAGFMTNTEENIYKWLVINGEKVVCLAQGGECRRNPRFYSPGLDDPRSWRTPVIDKSCPDNCPSRYIVCDNHGDHKSCIGAWRPKVEFNKF